MDNLGICTYGLIPIRALPSEAAEQTSQLIFGEAYEIHETIGRWTLIRTLFDNYEGWVDFKLPQAQSPDFMRQWLDSPSVISPTPLAFVHRHGDLQPMPVTGGSEFHLVSNASFQIGSKVYDFISDIKSARQPSDAVDAALQFYGAPYLWGGRTFFGIDCSGLSQIAYKICGKALPRDASQQVHLGTEVPVSQAQRNDLAFFQKPDGRICHVGLCMGDGKILHSSGSVRIDNLDSEGIYNEERQKYTHKLLCIKHLD